MFIGFPFSACLGFFLVFGVFFSLSSGHWLGVWFGLEINMMSFIPLLVQGGSSQSVESAIKYFLVQSLGSGFLLLGGFFSGEGSLVWSGDLVSVFFSFLLVLGLCIKLGLFPFHWWIPSVMGGVSWFCCGVLATWQKVAPFLLLLGLLKGYVVFAFCVGSVLVGGVGGVGQVQTRLLMAYSSISHLGWMVGISLISVFSGVLYYGIYFLISVFLFLMFWVGDFSRLSQGSALIAGAVSWVCVLGFFSLGGIPPMTGFFSKLVGFFCFFVSGHYFLMSFFILGSLVSLYFYLNASFVLVSSSSVLFRFFASGGYWGVLFGLSFLVFVGGFPLFEILWYLLYALGLFY